MDIKRAAGRVYLKLRGLDLNEMEEEWQRMDEARERRRRELQEAERRAREARDSLGTRVMGRETR